MSTQIHSHKLEATRLRALPQPLPLMHMPQLMLRLVRDHHLPQPTIQLLVALEQTQASS
jgi:hypothetical protein